MSAVPVALDALVALFTARLPGTQIVDGPPTVDVAGDVVAVGVTPQDPADVQSTEDIAGLGAVQESFDVLCMARSWSGNDGVKAQRDRTYALLGAVRDRLRADPTLNGAVAHVLLVGSSYMPWRTDKAQLVVDVPFRVQVRSLT